MQPRLGAMVSEIHLNHAPFRSNVSWHKGLEGLDQPTYRSKHNFEGTTKGQ